MAVNISNVQYTLQPYTADHRFSNTLNRMTRLITGGRDVILPYDVSGSVFDITAHVNNSRNKEPHAYDTNRDFYIDDDELEVASEDYSKGYITLDELNRIQELHDAPGYHFDSTTSDGYNINVDVSGTDPYWEYDFDQDYRIKDSELAIIKTLYDASSINLYNYLKAKQYNVNGGYHTDASSIYADNSGFVAGPKGGDPPSYIFDQDGDWRIEYNELQDCIRCQQLSLIDTDLMLRSIQFYNMGGYHDTTEATEDGYSPGPVPSTSLYVGPGFLVRQDMLIHVQSNTKISLTDTDNYIGDDESKWGLTRVGTVDGTSGNSKMYMLLAKYTYARSSPAPYLTYVIANDRNAYLNNKNDYLYLGSFEVELKTSQGFNYLGVTNIYTSDTDENNGNARIERPMYQPIISGADGGVIDEFGVVGPGDPISV